MARILALLDGSAYSESVCHHTAWIAKRLDASVEILHVLGRREEPATSDLSGALRLGARSALLKELSAIDEQRAKLSLAKGHAILEDAAAILERDGVSSVTSRLHKGDLLETVQEMEQDIRAITIGKRGEGAGFASGHLGSNLERIIRASKVPVFVASREFRRIDKVLVAYDGSASANVAIERMAQSPVFEGLGITVLCVGKDDADTGSKVERAAGKLQAAGMAVEARVVGGEPEDVLQSLAAEEGFNLLVMGAYGHSRIRNLIIGSTTTAMIQAVRIPVLLYR